MSVALRVSTRLFAVSLLLGASMAGPSARAEDKVAPEAEATKVVDRIVAIVNREPVTLFELRRAAAPWVAKTVQETKDKSALEAELAEVVAEALENLVDDVLIYDVAKEMDLTVGQDKVDAHIKKLMTANSWDEEEFAEALQQLGFSSVADYRRHTERELLKSQVIGIKVASRVKIDERDVDAAYLKEVAAQGTLEERRASHILIRLDELSSPQAVEAAQRALSGARLEIEGGQSFGEVARRVSQDRNKDAGGDLGWFAEGDLDPDFEAVAFKLPKGQVSEPFRTAFGLHLVVVTDVRQKSRESEDAEAAKRRIRMELREKGLERVYAQWVRGLRGEAFVVKRDLGLGP
jgi:parvulin-like peptidyl-prolyl isomerase